MLVFWYMVNIALGGALAYGPPNEPRDLGPIYVSGSFGALSEKYYPLTKLDNYASVNGRYFAEKFRNFLNTGLGAIPPLDPFVDPRPIPINLNDKEIEGTLTLTNFVLSGAQTFSLNTLEIRLGSKRVDFSIGFPVLTSEASFDANVKVDNSHNYFTGRGNVTLHNVDVTGSFSIIGKTPGAETNDQRLKINAIDYYFSTTNAQYNLNDNFLRKEEVPSLGAVSSRVVQTIAQAFAEKAAYAIALSIVKFSNQILSHYTAAQILALLLPYQNGKL